jgi:hypothetical protein
MGGRLYMMCHSIRLGAWTVTTRGFGVVALALLVGASVADRPCAVALKFVSI